MNSGSFIQPGVYRYYGSKQPVWEQDFTNPSPHKPDRVVAYVERTQLIVVVEPSFAITHKYNDNTVIRDVFRIITPTGEVGYIFTKRTNPPKQVTDS